MYKLTYFKAVNVIGFVSGLGHKTFEIDLSKFHDKDILVILGDNATGKSTFLSLVHPWHTPTDGRTKFIVPNKEGMLIRIYTGDDDTKIITKCIYRPKPDGTHLPKCYLSVVRRGEEEEIELNTNGNVSSYYDLLYTYFGITKDYINFASYNDSIGSIIRMTDTERKSSIANMVPNTARFDVAYSSINDKYKELRNSIRNIAQKILSIRDADSLKADIKRATKEIDRLTRDREDAMQEFSRIEGRVKEITKGKNVNQIIIENQRNLSALAQFDSDMSKIVRRLHKFYDDLNIDYEADSIVFDGMNSLANRIIRYEKKITDSESEIRNASSRLNAISKDVSDKEKSIAEIESVLFSLSVQDIGELRALEKQYREQLENLKYTKHQADYADMTYDEAIALSRTLSTIDQMISAMYEEYGDLVTQYFMDISGWNSTHTREDQVNDLHQLNATIETISAKKDVIYRKIIEKEQYSQFQAVLDQRPKNCTIDTCPFIVNALKWGKIAGELVELHKQFDEINLNLVGAKLNYDQKLKEGSFSAAASQLVNYISNSYPIINKYLHVSLDEIYRSIAMSTWSKVLDILKIKQIASVLSEKSLYIKLTTVLIPDTQRAIKMAEERGTNRDVLISQMERIHDELEVLNTERGQIQMRCVSSMKMVEHYRESLSKWRSIDELLKEYQELAESRIDTYKEAERVNADLKVINDLVSKSREYDARITEDEKALDELHPVLSQMQLDLKTLTALTIEKTKIESDFVIVDMVRQIIQPGKGLRKELINIYMFDIYQTANELLLSTFNGNLYLKEFIITDKEFTIPYVYNGSEGFDVCYASSAQQSIITTALSLAIISKMIDKYGIIAADELDKALAPTHKEKFIDILTKQARFIGVNQLIMISHSPEYYEPYDVGFIVFPGGKLHGKNLDVIKVD